MKQTAKLVHAKTASSMSEILENWKIGAEYEVELIPSYWGNTLLVTTADARCFILKKKADLLRAEQECILLSRLSQAGTPVSVPIRTVDASWHVSRQAEIFCLYPRLPGQIVKEHYAGNAAERAGAMGRAIALLHRCLLTCSDLDGYHDLGLMEQIREWAIPRIRGHRTIVDADLVEQVWGAVEQEMSPHYAELPEQLIHRDPHPANMLFESGRLSGFVDFEMVTRGPRIFDVCYCGTSLLVSGFPDKDKMKAWPALFHALVEGYQEMYPLTPYELSSLYGTLAAIELLFAAFSLETRAEEAARSNISVLSWLSANRARIAP